MLLVPGHRHEADGPSGQRNDMRYFSQGSSLVQKGIGLDHQLRWKGAYFARPASHLNQCYSP